jgi:hypothetical protein
MKIASILTILLSSIFVFAQSGARNLDLRIQLGAELTRPYESIIAHTDNYDFMAQPDNQTSLLARMQGELPGLPGFYYGVGGRLESSSRLGILDFRDFAGGIKIDAQDVQIFYSYFSFGAGCIYNWNFGLSIGAHLEGRVEAMSVSGPMYKNDNFNDGVLLTGRASYLRPWGRVHMDFTFNNRGRIRPFIGVEGAYPLLDREQRQPWAVSEEPQEKRLLESMMPKGSAAAYIGFRL